MFELLNRLSWIVCITLVVGLTGIEEDAFILWLIIGLIIKYTLFSPEAIKKAMGEKIIGSSKIEQDHVVSDRKVDEGNTKAIHVDSDVIKAENIAKTQHKEEKKENITLKEQTPPKIHNSEPNIFEKFFAENLLAKIGGILVFLGVMFFLSIIYIGVGPIGKILIGFIVGASLYLAGVVLDRKQFTNESKVLLATGIVVNYLVILSGRYLIGSGEVSSSDTSFLELGLGNTSGILTVSVTFVFLILNTILGVFTGLVYKSRTFLIASFVLAYIIPFLVGTSSSEPYTLLGYSLIVFMGGMYLSYKQKDEILFPLATIFAVFMCVVAPYSDGTGWIVKLLSLNIIGAITITVIPVFKNIYSYSKEFLIAGIYFAMGILGVIGAETISGTEYILYCISNIGLLTYGYFVSEKHPSIYSVATIGSTVTLLPVILTNGLSPANALTSYIVIATFLLLNISVIFRNRADFIEKNIENIVTGLVTGILFVAYMVYTFGNAYFPGIGQGVIFLILGCIYGSLAYIYREKYIQDQTLETESSLKTFYTLSLTGISLFTISVAYFFAENNEIVCIIWLAQVSALWYLTSKIQNIKILIAGLVLFIIGTYRLAAEGVLTPLRFNSINIIETIYFSISYVIVLATYIFNAFLVYQKTLNPKWFYGVHNVFHIVGVLFGIGALENIIVGGAGVWMSLIFYSIVLALLGVFYILLRSDALFKAFLVFYTLFLTSHIGVYYFQMFDDRVIHIFYSLIIALVAIIPVIFHTFKNISNQNIYFFGVYGIYAFILSSLIVYAIFNITFAVTLYWGILAFGVLYYGMKVDDISVRTIGNYILILVVSKIFLYDIWFTGGNFISRVFALIIVGILMIIISTMYSRRYGNTIANEFDLGNIIPMKNTDSNNKQSHTPKKK